MHGKQVHNMISFVALSAIGFFLPLSEYLGTGWHVFRRFPLFGTGTGDLIDQLNLQYETDLSKLDKQFRRISHNQDLTSLSTFGIVGILVFWIALRLPALMKK